MSLNFSIPYMSVLAGMGYDRDAKGKAGTDIFDEMLAPREEGCGLTVVQSAVQGTSKSDECAADSAAAYGVSSFLESGEVLTGGGVPVSETCSATGGVPNSVVSGTIVPRWVKREPTARSGFHERGSQEDCRHPRCMYSSLVATFRSRRWNPFNGITSHYTRPDSSCPPRPSRSQTVSWIQISSEISQRVDEARHWTCLPGKDTSRDPVHGSRCVTRRRRNPESS